MYMCVRIKREPWVPEHPFQIPDRNPHIGKAKCFNRLVYAGYMCARMRVYRRIREGDRGKVGYFLNSTCPSRHMYKNIALTLLHQICYCINSTLKIVYATCIRSCFTTATATFQHLNLFC
jgi:hypothetical protein